MNSNLPFITQSDEELLIKHKGEQEDLDDSRLRSPSPPIEAQEPASTGRHPQLQRDTSLDVSVDDDELLAVSIDSYTTWYIQTLS